MARPSRAAPLWPDRRERLPGGQTVESGFPVAVPLRAAPRLDRGVGSPVVVPRGGISGGYAAGSDLRWYNRGVGSPVVVPQDRISGGCTAGSDLSWLDRGLGSAVVVLRGRISPDLRWLYRGVRTPVVGLRSGSMQYNTIHHNHLET